MSELLDINFELGDLSEWDTLLEAGDGSLSVASAAALGATNFGMKVTDSTGGSLYGQTAFSTSSNEIRIRFYFDPNGTTPADSKDLAIFVIRHNSGVDNIVILWYKTDAGGDRFLYVSLDNDADGLTSGADVAITDKPHLIELRSTKATNSFSADATLEFYLDGVEVAGVSDIDLFDRWDPDLVRMGAISSWVAGDTGSFYFDELIVNDNNNLIGPVTISSGARTRYTNKDYGNNIRGRYNSYESGRY